MAKPPDHVYLSLSAQRLAYDHIRDRIRAGLLAGGSSLQLTAQSSIIPALVGDRLRSALAFNFGAYQLTGIIGPALGGLTIAALGGFAYAGLSGLSQMNNLRATCAPGCDPSRVTSARNEIMVGDILGYVALAAAGVTALLVVTRPAVPVEDPAR